jgi:hypothetical protein
MRRGLRFFLFSVFLSSVVGAKEYQSPPINCERLLSTLILAPYPSRLTLIKAVAISIDPLAYSKSQYGNSIGTKIVRRLQKIGKDFDRLCVDAGLVSKFDEFERFIKNLDSIPNDPWIVREAFSKSLGTIKIYRAIAVDEEEAQFAVNGGLVSPFEFNVRTSDNSTIQEIFKAEVQEGLILNFQKRFGRVLDGRLKFNLFQSVSLYPDAAVGISKTTYGDSEKPFLALFEIEIPYLDLIEPSKSKWVKYPGFVHYGRHLLRLRSIINFQDGRSNTYIFDHKIESVILGRIEATEIQKIYLLKRDDSHVPLWRGKIFGGTPTIEVSKEEFLAEIKNFRLR